MDEKLPKVGMGVMVWKEGKILLGKRKGPRGEGFYAWPGGHMEFGESFADCAIRETLEETGMEIENVRFLRLFNFKYDGKHYVDIGVMADWKSGEPQLREPDVCEGWAWYSPEELPEPVWTTIPSYFESLKTGRNFYDY